MRKREIAVDRLSKIFFKRYFEQCSAHVYSIRSRVHTHILTDVRFMGVCACLYTKSSHNVFALVVGCLHVFKCEERKTKRKKNFSMLKYYNGEYGKSVLITLKTSDGSQVAHYLSVFKSV